MPARTRLRTPAVQPCPGPPRPVPAARPPRAFLDLGAALTAPGRARDWTAQILRKWRMTGLSDTAVLIVSELVTNAVKASQGLDRPVIRLALTLNQGALAILVRDGHPGVPQAQHPGADELSGRGLLLVETLSARFGWHPLEGEDQGKIIWAVLEAAPAAPGDPAARFTPLAPARPERARHPASGRAGPRTPCAHARH
jgi:anti-sigma regulatory factor (Ser/Thr protein kinase)